MKIVGTELNVKKQLCIALVICNLVSTIAVILEFFVESDDSF